MNSYTAKAAWENIIRGNKFSRWGADNARHFQESAARRLTSSIFLPMENPKFQINNADKIFCIGSCFARHIERWLIQYGFDCLSVPLKSDKVQTNQLTKFTTVAMLHELRWALDAREPFQESYLIRHQDDTYSDLHSFEGVSHVKKNVALRARKNVSTIMRRVLKADVVIITLGLVESWFDKKNRLFLNEPPNYSYMRNNLDRFSLHILGYQKNLRALKELYKLLIDEMPKPPRLLITISPVPFLSTFSTSDVVVANTYSKSVLRVIAQEFAAPLEDVDYVPIYESVVNSSVEAAWEPDRIHVTDVLVKANILNFLKHYLDDHKKSTEAGAELLTILSAQHRDVRETIGISKTRVATAMLQNPADKHLNNQMHTIESLNKLPDFETANAAEEGATFVFPRIKASSRMADAFGPEHLGVGPQRVWHAKKPVTYPQSIDIYFTMPLQATALWLQAQTRHHDRAPGQFSLLASLNGKRWISLLESTTPPSWHITGWASWTFMPKRAYRLYRLIIHNNCGDPDLLTLQRLWLEPRSTDTNNRTLPLAASSTIRF